jgi:hypothetical protein
MRLTRRNLDLAADSALNLVRRLVLFHSAVRAQNGRIVEVRWPGGPQWRAAVTYEMPLPVQSWLN